MIHLAQRANLATRQRKHEPRSAAEQFADWRQRAANRLGINADRVGRDQARAAAVSLDRSPTPTTAQPDIDKLAETTLLLVSRDRASWQWRHVYAQAQRLVRPLQLDAAGREQLLDKVVATALGSERSVPIGQPLDAGMSVPAGLRRSDGTSVFTRVGGQRYTSNAVLAAESRILEAASLTGGRVASEADLLAAVAEWQANDTSRRLNAGQEHLATEMANSGRRVQLALAPAGTGKTTALGILATAWRNSGGDIVALAPQASAAQQMSQALGGAKADTLDKLVWEVTHNEEDQQPDWVASIGPDSLVLIDEAGLASTHNLDVAIDYVLERGGSVRLIGDDRQLGAVGAGGLLRDLEAAHGALTLDEVMRFTDKVEGAASLALREGDPAALGYYLDRGRIHAVTVDSVADAVFAAAQADLARGADVLMIAPDLDMVAALNARARAERLTREPATGLEVQISGAEWASAGDLIITKQNRRQISLGGTDHVKNNDRFIITEVHPDGSLSARHTKLGRVVELPSWYVRDYVRLGYAATLRSEQGDTVGGAGRPGITHTVITDSLGAAEVYMGMTRGTAENHAWVIAGGDGEAHSVIYPEALSPQTAVEVLTDCWAARIPTGRSPPSWPRPTTRPASWPLRPALTGTRSLPRCSPSPGPIGSPNSLRLPNRPSPTISAAPAWEALRAHLAAIDLTGADPLSALAEAGEGRELDSAEDLAAVLDYRLDPTGTASLGAGPLPWLPALPAAVAGDEEYGPYLRAHAATIAELAATVTTAAEAWTAADAPAWALPYLEHPDLVRTLALWRAAAGAPVEDLRPAGPAGSTMAMRRHRGRLLDQALAVSGLAAGDAPARWAQLITELEPRLLADDRWPVLAARLNTADTLGLDVAELVASALRQGPLPDAHPADALWWRLVPHLAPTGTEVTMASYRARPPWTDRLHRRPRRADHRPHPGRPALADHRLPHGPCRPRRRRGRHLGKGRRGDAGHPRRGPRPGPAGHRAALADQPARRPRTHHQPRR